MEGSKIIKEEFKLLDLSGSDSEWDIQELPVANTVKRKKFRRRQKKPVQPQAITPAWCPNFSKNALRVIFIGFFIFTVGGLVWFSVNIHYRLNVLVGKFHKVEIENENLPAELHGYHSSLQEILKNQTQFRDDLLNLSNKVESLSDQVLKIVAQLKSVESKVAKGPEPLSLQTLQTTVGNFGSHLTDLASAVKDIELNVKELGSQQQIMDNKLSQMKTNVTVALENCTSKEGHELMDQKIKIVNDALSSVNKSLSYQLQETNTEVHKHHDSISDLNNRLVVVGRSLNITTNKLDQISQSQIP